MKIGFIGTGLMGVPMIKNLLKSKNKISIFNRTIKKAQKLSKYGAIVSLSIDQLVKDKDVIITMLTDDKAVNQIISSKKFLYFISTFSDFLIFGLNLTSKFHCSEKSVILG